MALATQCPHCHTTFRVAHDQLKLRAGLVRCGSCKQIFNGIENLLRPEAAAAEPPPPAPPPPEPVPAPPTSPPQSFNKPAAESQEEAADDEPAMPEQAAPPEPAADQYPIEAPDIEFPPEGTHASEPAGDDPLQRMTLVDISAGAHETGEGELPQAETRPAMVDELDALEKAIDDLQRQPWRSPAEHEADQPADTLDQADDSGYEEPGFVKQGRRRQRIGRMMRILMVVGLPVLLVAMLAQGVYIFRNQLAAWFPQAKPALTAACRLMDCQVGLPAQIDLVAIESSELQAAGTDQKTFSLSVLLSNHGATVQAWPSIELTLNDADDKAIARRVFSPRDYLRSATEIDKGFAPKSEQAIKLYFELAQLKASGYRVYLFYP